MIKSFLYFPDDPIPEDVKQTLQKQGVPPSGWNMLLLSSNPDEFLEGVEFTKDGKTVYQYTLLPSYRKNIARVFPQMSLWMKVELKGKPYGVGMVYADES